MIGFGFVALSDPAVSDRAVLIHRDEQLVLADCGGKILDGGFEGAGPQMGSATRMIRERRPADLNGARIIIERLLQHGLGFECSAAPEKWSVILRNKGDSFREIGDRAVVIAIAVVRTPAAAKDACKFGVDRQCPIIFDDCRIEPAGLFVRDTGLRER